MARFRPAVRWVAKLKLAALVATFVIIANIGAPWLMHVTGAADMPTADKLLHGPLSAMAPLFLSLGVVIVVLSGIVALSRFMAEPRDA